jgi:hypothetical protein
MCPGPEPVSPPWRRFASRALFWSLTWELPGALPTITTTDDGPWSSSPSGMSSTCRAGSWNQPFRTRSSEATSALVLTAVARTTPEALSARAPSNVISKRGSFTGYSKTLR